MEQNFSKCSSSTFPFFTTFCVATWRRNVPLYIIFSACRNTDEFWLNLHSTNEWWNSSSLDWGTYIHICFCQSLWWSWTYPFFRFARVEVTVKTFYGLIASRLPFDLENLYRVLIRIVLGNFQQTQSTWILTLCSCQFNSCGKISESIQKVQKAYLLTYYCLKVLIRFVENLSIAIWVFLLVNEKTMSIWVCYNVRNAKKIVYFTHF